MRNSENSENSEDDDRAGGVKVTVLSRNDQNGPVLTS